MVIDVVELYMCAFRCSPLAGCCRVLAQPLMSLNEQCGFPVRTFRDAAVPPPVDPLSVLRRQEPYLNPRWGGSIWLGRWSESLHPRGGAALFGPTFRQQEKNRWGVAVFCCALLFALEGRSYKLINNWVSLHFYIYIIIILNNCVIFLSRRQTSSHPSVTSVGVERSPQPARRSAPWRAAWCTSTKRTGVPRDSRRSASQTSPGSPARRKSSTTPRTAPGTPNPSPCRPSSPSSWRCTPWCSWWAWRATVWSCMSSLGEFATFRGSVWELKAAGGRRFARSTEL